MERTHTVLGFSALSTVILAHDLQNLLTIMASCVDALGRRPNAPPDERHVSELNQAIDGALRVSRELVGAVGLQQTIEPLTVDVHELLGRVRGLLQRVAGEHVHLVVNTEASAALVEAAPVYIEWILINLVANARDAMPDGGVVRVETASVERWAGSREAPRKERYLRLTVRDHGVGVRDEARAALFEPFFTTKSHGTGLGLTSVAVTVRSLRGWLYVETRESEGTSVHVLLPLAVDRSAG